MKKERARRSGDGNERANSHSRHLIAMHLGVKSPATSLRIGWAAAVVDDQGTAVIKLLENLYNVKQESDSKGGLRLFSFFFSFGSQKYHRKVSELEVLNWTCGSYLNKSQIYHAFRSQGVNAII